MKGNRYYRSNTFRFRREYFGCYAWNFLVDPLEIGPGGAKILYYCNGLTVEEICDFTGYAKDDVTGFLASAEEMALIQTIPPRVDDKFFETGFYHDYCLSAPRAVFFEVTRKCNLRCRHCYTTSGVPDQVEVDRELIFHMLSDMAKNGIFQTLRG